MEQLSALRLSLEKIPTRYKRQGLGHNVLLQLLPLSHRLPLSRRLLLYFVTPPSLRLSPHTAVAALIGRGKGDWLWVATATTMGGSGFAARGHGRESMRDGSTGDGLGRDRSITEEVQRVGDGDAGSTARSHGRGRSTGGNLGKGSSVTEEFGGRSGR
uniref:Uncharacterized protein n=1 Tax=Oryza punctata TaxID=4537 RepID=A0A0E0KMQ5_ORYPU